MIEYGIDSNNFVPHAKDTEVFDESEADVVCSDRTDDDFHYPVLDLDYPVRLVESSTPGHYHLFVDRKVKWDDYKELLFTLQRCGLIEPGYVRAALSRGYTAVRIRNDKHN